MRIQISFSERQTSALQESLKEDPHVRELQFSLLLSSTIFAFLKGLSSWGTKDSRDFIIKYTTGNTALKETPIKLSSSGNYTNVSISCDVVLSPQCNSHGSNRNTGQTSLIQVSSTVQAALSKPFRFANSALIPDELWFNLCETTLWIFLLIFFTWLGSIWDLGRLTLPLWKFSWMFHPTSINVSPKISFDFYSLWIMF